MIGRMSGACRFNIYKFSQILGLQSMEVVSKRDDFVVNALFYFEPVQRGDMFSLGFQLLCKQGSFVVTGDEIFVFVESLGKVSYNRLI